jgi:putative redox protein
VVDVPAEQGGSNRGPTPKELIAAALSACTAITLRAYADRKGWDLGELEVVAEALPTEPGVTRFEVILRLDSNLSEEQVRRLETIASRCPVHRLLVSADAAVIDQRVERA